ncbi:hypothetical protein KTD15_06365 [Burkholderia multivorans]|uniref:hypothetical protein n=1 Tax=Burkholderia multivorans TaxID=87883 RepID=UPI001C218D93|nr:hypothetical protein [Burkholderia multivorans]MBU9118418.1 hypothetical protein [Burkholderia multivorans]
MFKIILVAILFVLGLLALAGVAFVIVRGWELTKEMFWDFAEIVFKAVADLIETITGRR